jgi:hypothetical protein
VTRISHLSSAARLNVIGLVLTAAGMLLQIAAGSHLYPTFSGPIVLLVAAVVVAVGFRSSWTPYVAIVVPLVLGVGAIIAGVMTGEFFRQLTNVGVPGIFLGTVMHVIGLAAAVAGGIGMLLDRRGPVSIER